MAGLSYSLGVLLVGVTVGAAAPLLSTNNYGGILQTNYEYCTPYGVLCAEYSYTHEDMRVVHSTEYTSSRLFNDQSLRIP